MLVSCFLCFAAAALINVASGIAIGKWQKPNGQQNDIVHARDVIDELRPAELQWLALPAAGEDENEEWVDCSNRTADEDPWMIDGNSYNTASLKNYKRLFEKWHGKTVAFAGDSLIREVWVTLACAASLLGATVQSTMVERVGALPSGTTTPHVQEYGPLLQKNHWKDIATQENRHMYRGLAASHGLIKVSGGGMKFSMHLYQYFHTLDLDLYQDKVRKNSPLVIHNRELVRRLQNMHMTYLNMGHTTLHSAVEELPTVFGSDPDNTSHIVQACQDHFAGFLDLVPKHMKVTLIEHPPSHFNSHDGDSDAASFAGCKCNSLATLKQQFNYQCERGPWLAKYLKGKRNIQMATWFEDMAPLCKHHFHEHTSGDCRHFDNNPALHDPLVSKMWKLLHK